MKTFQTKQDFESLLFQIINPLKDFYSPGCAQLKIGSTSAHYEDESAWMEGFSRPLWGLVPLWSGGTKEDIFTKIYQNGLINGTDPENKEYWGACRDYDQKLVEMAAIAYGLLFSPDILWEPLAPAQKHNLVEWLNEINRNECCECNWKFFNILVNIALKKLNVTYSEEKLLTNLDYIESCHLENGWYIDGENGQSDYYIPFAMQFYGIIYAIAMKDEDPLRCERFLTRAMEFGKDFIYWFSDDGSALPYGRSLTYRFAQCSFYSACIAAKIEPLPLPIMKGIVIRHFNYWMEQPIFDHTGLLTIGYCYPNLTMSENYNAPGSPYWSLKSFAFLTLEENDPFWSLDPEPLPQLNSSYCIKPADMLIQRCKDGNVVAFPAGRTLPHSLAHTEEKYSKFAYSTKYGFSVLRSSQSLAETAPDSILSFDLFGHIYIRGQISNYQLDDTTVSTSWSPLPGIEIQTKIILTEYGHRREHIIQSDYVCTAHDAGFAVPYENFELCQVKCVKGNASISLLKPDPNTNLIHSKTWIPMADYNIQKGKNEIITDFYYNF